MLKFWIWRGYSYEVRLLSEFNLEEEFIGKLRTLINELDLGILN